MLRKAVICGLVFLVNSYTLPKSYLEDVHLSVEMAKLLNKTGHPNVKEVCFGELGCFPGCVNLPVGPQTPEEIDTKFYIVAKNTGYRKDVEVKYSEHMDLSSVPHGSSVAMIVHGWTENSHDQWMLKLREGAKRHYDAVINVDWTNGASPFGIYLHSVPDTEVVGRQMALLADRLVRERGVAKNKIHMYGFSLGGQIVGFAGRYTQSKYGFSLDRVIPIDPAGPLYEGTNCHVQSSDGQWVTAIHTTGGGNILNGDLGMVDPVGHIDFYANGGQRQPGCGSNPIDNLVCHHYRAVDLTAESLEHKCRMDTYPCGSWEDYQAGRCRNARADSEFGYPANRSARGKHYFETTDKYPWCKK